MPVPGDRRNVQCRGRSCGAQILLIYSVGGKWVPCEKLPSHVDGERMLVFANGVVGKRYGNYDGGHETHFAHCKDADEFRRKRADPEPAPYVQGVLGFESEPEEEHA